MSDIEQTQSAGYLSTPLAEAEAAASGHSDIQLAPMHSIGAIFVKFMLTLSRT